MLAELDGNSIETQRKWLLFMLERVGHNNLPRLLDHYESIGWISQDVADRLLELADEVKRYNGSVWTLTAEEHRTSFFYIEKLLGMQVDDSLLLSLPRRDETAGNTKNTKNKTRPSEGYLEAHQLEKEGLEHAIQRREVTVKNLEQELEMKNREIEELGEKIKELESQISQCRIENKKNLIFRGIFEENTRLKKMKAFGQVKTQKT